MPEFRIGGAVFDRSVVVLLSQFKFALVEVNISSVEVKVRVVLVSFDGFVEVLLCVFMRILHVVMSQASVVVVKRVIFALNSLRKFKKGFPKIFLLK
jgi:hypothetical protein